MYVNGSNMENDMTVIRQINPKPKFDTGNQVKKTKLTMWDILLNDKKDK